ncbi:MAG: hypothetical protein HYU51_19225 [Candidatus Rokubacteria bacterium]|nr:hypothetical protein [Candidatus Rokubacteria bacterium]
MTSDERQAPDDDVRHRRGLTFRRRDDYAVELFHEALAKLGDAERVGRILLELGRFYNPYLDAPIVDVASRRAVLEALERGDVETARTMLEQRLASYTRPSDGR